MTAGSIRTTCPYCGVGCGVLARSAADGPELIGDPLHPANFGALCSKGSALAETLGMAGRLLQPCVHGKPVAWATALDHVADGFRRTIEQHGPESVALYVSGQLLTEDYYVANKLMKGFVGSANIDTNSRLCMASAVAAHKRSFGEDLVPVSYEDLERADLVVLVGSNLAWCHPVLFQRLVRIKAQRSDFKVIVVDPRRTATCDVADLHVSLKAGTDVLLFNGLLAYLAQAGCADAGFIEAHTEGAASALEVAKDSAGDLEAVARACAVHLDTLKEFYALFARTDRVVTLFSQGVNQSSSGTDKANSIINLHLLTGRIGRLGAGPFSITGQPNAMGGREVGGLATTLAAHMELDNPKHRQLVQSYWRAPRLAERPGLKAVDLFEAIHDGKVKAVWIMATNPVVSLPNADRVRRALESCEFVVVSDCVANTDTAALAHVLLPAAAWGEKDGTVTNSERCISRQRAFLTLPGEARPDWWAICELARRLGFGDAFAYRNAHEIFLEHARLSAWGNEGERRFNIGGLAGLSAEEYENLTPVQWPVPGDGSDCARLFHDGRFSHPDGRARLIPTLPKPPRGSLDEEYPLVLNTGRIRDQWHSMTRSGRAPRLASHHPEPFVDMHAADALSFGVREGSLVRVVTQWGQLVARACTSGEMARGAVFVSIHWSDENASAARVGALVGPCVDPLSGEPEFKYTPARIEPYVVNWYGFVLSREPIDAGSLAWWSRAQAEGCLRYEIAGRSVPDQWQQWARALLGAQGSDDFIDYEDASIGKYRAAYFHDDRLLGCLSLGPQPELPSRAALVELFQKPSVSPAERSRLLGGRVVANADITVCACFGVSRGRIEAAIESGCTDTRALGRALKAGTNCGSCVPDLHRLLQSRRPLPA